MTQASRRSSRALVLAVVALAIAVALALSFPAWRGQLPYGWSLAASYLVTWGPLVIALIAGFAFWWRFLRFRAVDLVVGLGIGLVARAVGIIAQYASTGRMPSAGVMLGGISGTYVFTTVIAPVVLAPLIEEPFFRGLLQGSLSRGIRPWPALIVTSVAFALVHTIADGWSTTLIVTMLAFGLLAGYAVLRTKRLGPAIIGHAVFNGLAALITWPW
ncbi:CPBP family intramembrane glutamic endopeptidase [Gryllotalpicola daejeonensis]